MSKLIYLADGHWEYAPEPNYYSEVVAYRYFSGLYKFPGYSPVVLRSDRYQLDHTLSQGESHGNQTQ